MKHSLLLISIFFSIVSSAQTNQRKLLFIGIDGCRADVLMSSNTPNVHSLLDHAVYSTEGLCAYKTWSGNGWSSMLTGVWHTKHGVTDNTFSGSNYANYPDFIQRMEAYDSSLKTISTVHWGPINSTIIQDADIENIVSTDLEVKNSAVQSLSNDDPDVLFLDFDDVDHAGHGFGFSATIPEYVDAIELTDTYVGEILTALYNRPQYANENWLVVLTTDHGGNVNGHGRGSIDERSIFTIYNNPEFAPEPLNRVAISNTQTSAELHLDAGTFARPTNQSAFSFGASQDFTIEFWVKPTAYTGDPALISNKNWNAGLNTGFVISAQDGAFWKVNIGDGSDRADIEGGYLQPGQWHHLAVSFDRDGLMTAYEDGAFVGFEKLTLVGNIDSGLPFTINQDGTGTYGYDFDGSLKDIRVWNTVIPNDVLVNWAGIPVTAAHPYYAQLIANWKCDASTETQFTDASPAGNHCPISGNYSWSNNQSNTFTVYDYSTTSREPDNAVTALTWMCVPIETAWNLDGHSWVNVCDENPLLTTHSAVSDFSIYPNPSNGQFTLQHNLAGKGQPQLRVYNALGKLVLHQNITTSSTLIQGENLSKGVYLIQLSDGQSGTQLTRKLVVE